MIDLRRVEMGPAGARALAECPALRAVETLDLEGNVLGDAGLAALAASPYLTRLRVLSLRENRISDDGVRALSRSPVDGDPAGPRPDRQPDHRGEPGPAARGVGGVRLAGPIQLKVDSQLRTRPLGIGPLGGFFRRPQS